MEDIIIVINQAELDAVPESYMGRLELHGDSFELSRNMNSEIHAYGNAEITLRGISKMYIHGDCTAQLYDKAYVCADGNCTVKCYDSSRNMVSGNSTAYMYNHSQAYGLGEATVYLYNFSRGSFCQKCRVFSFGCSTVITEDFRGSVVARDGCIVRGNNSTGIEIHDHCTARMENNSVIHCYDHSTVRLTESMAHLHGKSRSTSRGYSKSIVYNDD